MSTWVLVAHRAGARLFGHAKKQLELLQAIDHPEGRLKDVDLGSDRPGRLVEGRGGRPHGVSQTESPRERVTANFARRLAALLDDGRVRSHVDEVVLVAEPGFLGVLQGCLSPHTAALVRTTVTKDLADVPDRDLPKYLADVLLF